MTVPFEEQFRPIVAQAMDEGWDTLSLCDAFEQIVEMERKQRMEATAAKLYGHNKEQS